MRNNEQMELGLAGANQCPRSARRQSRVNRSNWWFNQMRHLVDEAFDWEPAPEPRFRVEQHFPVSVADGSDAKS